MPADKPASDRLTAIDDLHSVLDWVRWGASEFSRAGLFFGHGTDNAWDEAALLVLWALDQPWQDLERIQHCRLTRAERQQIFSLFRQRIEQRVPAAYLTGVAWFAGLPFKVTRDVLVPRSPIAELIAKGFAPWLGESPATVLDLCTGSGCIGIACAHQMPQAEVILSDISEPALAVARQNIDFHDLQDRVYALHSDGFDQLGAYTFDLIVANPPYVDADDLASMPAEYRAEPQIGLASGVDGLDFTRRLLAGAAERLNPGGVLVVEVGNSWVALEQAFPQLPFTWPEFENGGHGVFILSREQLTGSL